MIKNFRPCREGPLLFFGKTTLWITYNYLGKALAKILDEGSFCSLPDRDSH